MHRASPFAPAAGQRRSRLADAIVLLVLLPTWLMCFALCVREAARDTPYPIVRLRFSASDSQPFPTVINRGPDAPRGSTTLQPGDRLLRWGDVSLAYVGQVEFLHIVAKQGPTAHAARVTAQRHGREIETGVPTISHRMFLARLVAALVFVVACLTFRFRADPTPTIRSFECALWGGAFLLPCFFGVETWLIRASWVVSTIGFSVLVAFVCRAFQRLAHRGLPVAGWQRALPCAYALLGPLDVEREFGLILPQRVATISMIVGLFGGAVYLCIMVIRIYRTASPIERRKIKWLVWGVHVALSVPSLLALLVLIDLDFTVWFYVSIVSIAAFPMALLIAVLRFNLFDVDRLISHTAFYATLATALIMALVGALPQITAAICPLLDLPELVVQLVVASVLVIAGALAQRSIVPAIERRLHPERFAFEAHVQSVIGQVRKAGTADEVFELLSIGMGMHLRPVSLGIYLCTQDGFRTAHAVGRDAASMLRVDSPLLSTAARSGQMINVEGGSAKRFAALDDHDRVVLQALGLALVLPLHRNADCMGLILLGQKSSGDVYVASECALLLALSHAISQRLASIEWQAVMADARRGHEALRRYVPAVVANEIVRGRHLAPVEREVSLLFVDIRGYSRYSEGRSVADVFSTVNRYTHMVSAVVADHGGTIVEFNGDGMMALFGAPVPMIGKELRAVEAALFAKRNSVFASNLEKDNLISERRLLCHIPNTISRQVYHRGTEKS